MNELRAVLEDSQKLYATRVELAALRDEMERRFSVIEADVARRFTELLDPKTGVYAQMSLSSNQLRTWAITLLTAVLLLILGLLAHLFGIKAP